MVLAVSQIVYGCKPPLHGASKPPMSSVPSHDIRTSLPPRHDTLSTPFIALPVAQRCIDCCEDSRGSDLRCLAKNVAYIGRYYSSTNPHKNITRAEGLSISKSGMRILMFYQDWARSPGSFGAARGERDGAVAWHEAHAVGQPPGTAIYFCADYDAPEKDIQGPILTYFEHLTAGMETARRDWERRHPSQYAGTYSPGIYAGPPVIRAILTDPKRTLPAHPFVWLSMPPIWHDAAEKADYDNSVNARHWTNWQRDVAAICHRNGQPSVGFPCDSDEIGTPENGSFTLD
jgi:hypothetical protein